MQLDEVSLDSKITINVRKDGKGATFFAKPEFFAGGSMYIAPIMHGAKLLNFNIPDLKIEVVATKENQLPARFKNIKIEPERVNGRTYHCVSTKTAGAKSNRRNAIRVLVGEAGKVSEDLGGPTKEVFIKDISVSGISFVIDPKKHEYRVGEKVKVHYVDPIHFYTVDVDARVVRTEDSDKGRMYGCAFTRNYPQITRYVAVKQAHQINKKRPRY